MNLNYDQALLSPGIPGHIHFEQIARDTSGHEIGVCKCGRRIDYLILQKQVFGMTDGYTHLNSKRSQRQ